MGKKYVTRTREVRSTGPCGTCGGKGDISRPCRQCSNGIYQGKTCDACGGDGAHVSTCGNCHRGQVVVITTETYQEPVDD